GGPGDVGAEVDAGAVVGARLEGARVAREVARAGGRLRDGDRRALGRHGEHELRLLAARRERGVVADGRRIRAVDGQVVGAVAGDRPVEDELDRGTGRDRAEGLEAGAVDRGPGVVGDGRLAPRVVADHVHRATARG